MGLPAYLRCSTLAIATLFACAVHGLAADAQATATQRPQPASGASAGTLDPQLAAIARLIAGGQDQKALDELAEPAYGDPEHGRRRPA